MLEGTIIKRANTHKSLYKFSFEIKKKEDAEKTFI